MPGFTNLAGHAVGEQKSARSLSAEAATHAPGEASRPPDGTVEAVPIDALLDRHGDLLARLKLCYGADRETFDVDIMSLIRCYAENVSTLPGTRDEAFHEPGGLLRMGLEIAFFALQAADSYIFSGRGTISARRDLEPRWRLAAFVAGLCTELHRPLSQFIVTDAEGTIWPVHLKPLALWLQERRCRHFRLRWIPRAEDSRVMGLCILHRIVPEATLQALSVDNAIIPRHLLSCIAGVPLYQEPNVLDHIVRRATALVLDRDLRAQTARDGAASHGGHVSRYLLEVMRQLVATDPAWRPNEPKSRVWLGPDGAFIAWPSASGDLGARLRADGIVGMPTQPAEMVEALHEAGAIQIQDDGHDTWLIRPPGAKSALTALKLAVPDWIGATSERAVSPLPGALLDRASSAEGAGTRDGSAPSGMSGSEDSTDGTASTNEQLPLFDSGAASDAPRTYLRAPPRLNPAVRAVLAEIVDTLNNTGQRVAAHWQLEGLLIPLAAVEARHLDTALAIRTLAEAGMLVLPKDRRAKTFSRIIDGKPVLGAIIDPKFIVQPLLPAGDFVPGPLADAAPTI